VLSASRNRLSLLAFFTSTKATGLERTKEELAKSEDLIAAIEGDLNRTRMGLQGKKDAQDLLKKELSELMALDKNEDEIRNCLAKLEWIDIHALEDVLRELENESQLKSDELEKAKIAKVVAESNESENGGNVDAINEKVREFQDHLSLIVADVDQKKLAVKRKNAELSAVLTDMKLITMNKAEHNSRLRQARSEVTFIDAFFLLIVLSVSSRLMKMTFIP
jgi:DNA helicase IV